MSLFLGNLTPRIRRDELERVFHRFGRCNIQLKDGYGFVHYDLPGNAEKALKALRGKNISGEPVNLTWANKQLKSFRRNMRGSRFYESHSVRGFTRREDHGTRNFNSHDQRGYKMVSKQSYQRDGELDGNDFLGEETGRSGDDAEDCGRKKHPNAKETLLDQEITVEPNHGENGRWGESASNPLDNNEVENGMNFDRYEPYHGYDRINEDKDHPVTNSHGSHSLGSPGYKSLRDCTYEATSKPPDDLEPEQRCFVCGKMGHLRHNCPKAGYRQEKFTRFDRRRENNANFRVRGNKELKSLRTETWGKKLNPSGSLPLFKQHKRDRKLSGSGKPQTLIISENTPALNETRWSPLRRDSRRKKKHRQEAGGSMKYHMGRKAKVSGSSPRLSKSTGSSLCSHSHSPSQGRSSTSRSRSRSRSRSVSPKSHSISSSSRSMSTSSFSGAKSSRSKSRSRSRSLSMSLSVSLGKPLASSPNKAPMEDASASAKEYLEKNGGNKRRRLVIDGGQPEDDASFEIHKRISSNDTTVKETQHIFKIEDEISNDQQEPWEEDGQHSHQGIENEAKRPCMTPSEAGAFGDNNLSLENTVEKREADDSQPAATQDTWASIEKQKPDVVASHLKNPLSISSQEMYMVSKHYRLAMPEENERNLPVEAYFGSACLWPWEIIYYRRLKKGPISIENYARRIAQNEEFGIVDKYIRGSSGWGECSHSSS